MVLAKSNEKVTDAGRKGSSLGEDDGEEYSSDDFSDFESEMFEDELGPELKVNNDPGKASNLPDVKEEAMSDEDFDRMMEERYKPRMMEERYKPGSSFVTYAEDGYDHRNSIDSIYVPSAKDPTTWKTSKSSWYYVPSSDVSVPKESGFGDPKQGLSWRDMCKLRGQPAEAARKGASAPSTAAIDADLIRLVPPTTTPTVSQTLHSKRNGFASRESGTKKSRTEPFRQETPKDAPKKVPSSEEGVLSKDKAPVSQPAFAKNKTAITQCKTIFPGIAEDPIVSMNWVKPLSTLTGKECFQFLSSLGTAKEREARSNVKTQSLCDNLSKSLTSTCFHFVEVVERLNNFDKIEQDLEEARRALQSRDRELVVSAKRLSAAEAELRKEETFRAEMEASLRMELDRVRRNHTEELVRLEAHYKQKLANERATSVVAAEQSYLNGARNLHRDYFFSKHGQQFLQILHAEMLEAYHKSPVFLRDLSPAFGFLVEDIGKNAAEQVGASSEQIAQLDFDALIDKIDESGLMESLGVDNSLPGNYEWWVPVLDKAVVFLFGDPKESNSAVEQHFYNPPSLQQLRARLAARASQGRSDPTSSSNSSAQAYSADGRSLS